MQVSGLMTVGFDVDDYSAYRSAELAELYDAVYADVGDTAFWESMADAACDGPLLELACGTGRVLLPLARAGREVAGIDLAPEMLARCRAKLLAEPDVVRDRVTLIEGDMTSFHLGRRFAGVFCTFGSFHHLRTVDQQLECLASCREHLLPGGRLVLDLINPDPVPVDTPAEDAVAHASADALPADAPASADAADRPGRPADAPVDDMHAGTVGWTHGRRVRSWATILGTDRSLQINDCEVTYEVIERDGGLRRVTETFPMRFLFRYELEHLLARAGFRITALYGDYDRSEFAGESLGLIAVAEMTGRPGVADGAT